MIAAVYAAHAADFDLHAQVPLVATQHATYTAEDETGVLVAQDPRLHVRGGLGTAVLLGDGDGHRPVVAGGVNLWSSVWEHTPEEVGVAVWEEWLGAGWRWSISPPEARVQGWFEAGASLHVQQALPTYSQGFFVVTPGSWFAGGVTIGTGKLRPQAGVRSGFVHPGASATGATSNTPDDFAWTWNAGRAWFDVHVGLAFR